MILSTVLPLPRELINCDHSSSEEHYIVKDDNTHQQVNEQPKGQVCAGIRVWADPKPKFQNWLEIDQLSLPWQPPCRMLMWSSKNCANQTPYRRHLPCTLPTKKQSCNGIVIVKSVPRLVTLQKAITSHIYQSSSESSRVGRKSLPRARNYMVPILLLISSELRLH
ncbi:hypothetical protein EMCRGX_G009714 [Ephydatia muelleri]